MAPWEASCKGYLGAWGLGGLGGYLGGVLFQAAQGLPRKLGLYGHHALLAAAVAKAKVVSPEHVQAALKEAS